MSADSWAASTGTLRNSFVRDVLVTGDCCFTQHKACMLWSHGLLGNLTAALQDCMYAVYQPQLLHGIQCWHVVLLCAGVGMSHLSGEVKRLISTLTKYDQDNYPEMLGRICIINAPMVFKAIWALVKPLLNPRTLSKIQVSASISEIY